jgi:hypothetical protein
MKRYTRFEEGEVIKEGYSSPAEDVEDLTTRFLNFAKRYKINYKKINDNLLKHEIEEFLLTAGEDSDYTNDIFYRIRNK